MIRVLRAVAGFDSFSAELCEALGVPGPAESLAGLRRRGFVSAPGEAGDWFSLHTLLRDFGRERWPLDEGERHVLLVRAARWYELEGLLAEALAAWRAADEPEEIVRVFTERHVELIDGGFADAVIDAAAGIPPELADVWAKHLWGVWPRPT